MNGKRLVIYSAVLIIVTCVATFILTTALNAVMFNYRLETGYDVAGTKIDSAIKLIKKNYYLQPDDEKLIDGAISGLVNSLGDPYSTYMDKEEYKDFENYISGTYSGIGVEVTADKEDKRILVVAPIEGTPADKAGVKPGDKILRVDGQDVWGDKLDEAVTKMKGEEGTSVSLDIYKADTKELKTINLVRKNIELKSLRSEVKEGNIGYIRIVSFGKNTGKNFVKEIEKLKEKNIKGLILDLRRNPGGIVDEAKKVAGVFLGDEQVVTYLEDRLGRRQYIKTSGDIYEIPLVVLIDEGSASASEIVAGALRDHNKAKLVGMKTFGKGLVQVPFPLGDGTYIKLTIARYFTPNGEDINERGIMPDIEVQLPKVEEQTYLTDENDTQLQKAIELLR